MSRIEQIAEGDAQALAEEYELHRPRLKRLVELRMDRRLQRRVDASDIMQEAYLDIAKRATEYAQHPSMSFFIWLRLITVQKLFEVHRRHLEAQQRDIARELVIRDIGPEASTHCLASKLIGDATPASQRLERQEQQTQLIEILNQMNRVDREILSLRHFEDLTNSEVAELLGLSKTAASNRYIRALLRLKSKLAEIPEFLQGDED